MDLTIVTGIIGSIMAACHEAAKAKAGLVGFVVAILVGLAIGVFDVWIVVSIARRIRWGKYNSQARVRQRVPRWQLICTYFLAMFAYYAWVFLNVFLGQLTSREALHLVF